MQKQNLKEEDVEKWNISYRKGIQQWSLPVAKPKGMSLFISLDAARNRLIMFTTPFWTHNFKQLSFSIKSPWSWTQKIVQWLRILYHSELWSWPETRPRKEMSYPCTHTTTECQREVFLAWSLMLGSTFLICQQCASNCLSYFSQIQLAHGNILNRQLFNTSNRSVHFFSAESLLCEAGYCSDSWW